MIRSLLWFILVLYPFTSVANVYPLPEKGSRLVGEIQRHIVQKGEYFQTIAKDYDIGILELMAANPGVDPFLPKQGTLLIIPTEMLLPDVPREGVVINLPELRLYYFPKGKQKVYVFPVGIGRIGRETPIMITKVKSRIPNPTWTPPASIRKEHLEERGEVLPSVVQPGPDNPLGKFAIQLAYGTGSYLIHGTNQNFGIGMRVSSGCIRLSPDNIEWLFNNIKRGEKVTIINQVVKTSSEPSGRKIIEVHSPLSKTKVEQVQVVNWSSKNLKFMSQFDIDISTADEAIMLKNGLPVDVGLFR
ncbi:L,D-transpeptidase family protein [Shewanella surugensis]|uniref:L,D-transpeptidase family protein n=1 Tax=Shewanella surugensis TaxID=212020 RepID=A0ABT0L636_9GAMM|nr:L,D-transpeptidase family protein [Shewanella surugensis]MCL1123151.1 L,D-transpeptidase family protein [Shewanella surugensis]